jgi:hypothetical protein
MQFTAILCFYVIDDKNTKKIIKNKFIYILIVSFVNKYITELC